jgi:hypothetical protein
LVSLPVWGLWGVKADLPVRAGRIHHSFFRRH